VGAPGTFDGISVYRLDSRGKVYQHEVTDVQMRDPVSLEAGSQAAKQYYRGARSEVKG
jgi:hypothetical protein